MSGIVETITTFTIYIIQHLGYYGVFIGMTLESVGIPLPSEVIMPFAGYVAWIGQLTIVGVTLAGTLGSSGRIAHCLRGGAVWGQTAARALWEVFPYAEEGYRQSA